MLVTSSPSAIPFLQWDSDLGELVGRAPGESGQTDGQSSESEYALS